MTQCSLFQNDPIRDSAPVVPVKASLPGGLALDTETTGTDPLSDTLVGISLCKEKGTACYIPVRHSEGPNLPAALSMLKSLLEDESIPKIGHNLKFDILILRQEGIRMKGKILDTMVASYLLSPNKQNHSLEDVGLEYLGYRKRSFSEVLGKRKSFADLPVSEATPYAAEDAELAMELRDTLFERLKEEGMEKLYFGMEMPLISVLAEMEWAGVKIDKDRLREISKELERDLEGIETRIYTLAGERFNINSPKQLAKILFESLGLRPTKKTKTGFSTSVDVLEELAKTHELPGEILNYRTLFKLKSTYVDALPKLINERTGRVHTSFNQTVTATGRLSSSDPNLQNIPVRGEWGTRIREVFIADEGHHILSADYSQVELRVLAHISGDEGLRDAFQKGIDVHSRTAAEIFGISLDAVTSDMRRIAKTVNFGVVYGISPFGLSEALGISQKEAATYIQQYFEKHPGVKAYMEGIVEAARESGYVTTLIGRKRPVPELRSGNAGVRQQAERLTINSPIQGTAADLIKIAMINIMKELTTRNLKTRMLLQIHDELLFEVPEGELEEIKTLVREGMEKALDLTVPLHVDMGWGRNWAEAHS
ncbi:MAG: DNA polymerase I [Nitrospirales bacterium]|nr:DNA polymerase I [Nitrospirales bacterium]